MQMSAHGAEPTVRGLGPRVRFPPLADPERVRFRDECLELNLLRKGEGVVNFDTQISHSALKLSVSKK
jgi:hypothetical protein